MSDQAQFFNQNISGEENYPVLNISFERNCEFDPEMKPYELEYNRKHTCPKCKGSKMNLEVKQPICENCMG